MARCYGLTFNILMTYPLVNYYGCKLVANIMKIFFILFMLNDDNNEMTKIPQFYLSSSFDPLIVLSRKFDLIKLRGNKTSLRGFKLFSYTNHIYLALKDI